MEPHYSSPGQGIYTPGEREWRARLAAEKKEYSPPEAVRPRMQVARQLLREIPQLETPFLMYDKATLGAQFDLWRSALPNVTQHLAVKSCSAIGVLQYHNALGSSFDAATAGELRILQAVGVDPEKVIVTRPVRDRHDFNAINTYKPRALVVEDIVDLRFLAMNNIPRADYRPQLILRLQFPYPGLGGKFGMKALAPKSDGSGYDPVLERMEGFIKAVKEVEAERGCSFRAFGLSTHVGTNTASATRYKTVLEYFSRWKVFCDRRALPLTIFDIGGGYSDRKTAAAAGTTQPEFMQALARVVAQSMKKNPGVTYIAEPGRFMVADSGCIVMRLMKAVFDDDLILRSNEPDRARHHKVAHLRALMDDSLYKNLMGEWHDDQNWEFFPFLASRADFGGLSAYRLPAILSGETCDSVDTLERKRLLPANLPDFNLSRDALLLVPNAGAYTRDTGTNFNSILSSHVVMYEVRPDGTVDWELFGAPDREEPRMDTLLSRSLPKA